MRTHAARTIAVAAAGTFFAISGLALARAGERTFQQTYPVAAPLCERVAAGTEGRHLKRFAATVLTRCSTLQSSFAAAQNAVLVARAAISAQITEEQAAITAACPANVMSPRPLCTHARRNDGAALVVLHLKNRAAARRYYIRIEAARARFWSAIRALPGEHRVRTDVPIPVQSS